MTNELTGRHRRSAAAGLAALADFPDGATLADLEKRTRYHYSTLSNGMNEALRAGLVVRVRGRSFGGQVGTEPDRWFLAGDAR